MYNYSERTLTIKEMPKNERPREKLIDIGVEFLSNEELVAILLATGSKEKTALELARDIFNNDLGMHGLAMAQLEDFLKLDGIGPAKACILMSAVELGKRIAYLESVEKLDLSSPKSIADLMMRDMRFERVEKFKILLLDVKNQLISKEEISTGGINYSLVDAKVVFEPVIRKGATSIVLVHNHPSGDPNPSAEDKKLTERLSQAGKYLSIEVLDHIIIGDNKYYSFKENFLI